MKLYFKKGYNKDKPKRWYIFAQTPPLYKYGFGNIFNAGLPLITFESCASSSLKISLAGKGIHISCDKKLLSWQNKEHFVYFRCHADEAEFILKYSDGIEIDI